MGSENEGNHIPLVGNCVNPELLGVPFAGSRCCDPEVDGDEYNRAQQRTVAHRTARCRGHCQREIEQALAGVVGANEVTKHAFLG